jgi:hypothetical protein
MRAIEGLVELQAARTADVAASAPDERNIVRRLIGEEVFVFFMMSPSFSCRQQRWVMRQQLVRVPQHGGLQQ